MDNYQKSGHRNYTIQKYYGRTIVLGLALFVGLFNYSCELFNPGLGAKVDITPPVVSVDGLSSDNSIPYLNGDIVLAGAASDDRGVSAVKVTYQNAAGSTITRDATVSEGRWTITVPSGIASGQSNYENSVSDGERQFTIAVLDASGKSIETNLTVYIDNKSPTVLVTSPLTMGASRPTFTDSVVLKGEVYDASPITSVLVSLVKADGSLLFAAKEAEGTATWLASFDLKDDNGNTIAGLSDDTRYFYNVRVIDKAGNQNSYYFHRSGILTVMPAGTRFPIIDDIGRLDQRGTETSGITAADLTAIRRGNTAVPVVANDIPDTPDNRPFDPNPSGTPEIDFYNFGDFVFDEDASISFNFNNIDRSNPANQNLLPENSVLVGIISPPVGSGAAIDLDNIRMEVRKADTDWASADVVLVIVGDPNPGNDDSDGVKLRQLGAEGDTVSFTYYLPSSPFVFGQYQVKLSAKTDVDATLTVDNVVEFMIDSGVPTLTETELDPTLSSSLYRNAPFQLDGVATDQSGINKIEIRESFNSGALSLVQTITGLVGTNPSWTSADMPFGARPNGFYNYEITLTSSGGKTTKLYRSTNYDTALPLVSFANVAPLIGSNTVNGFISISIAANDISGIDKVRRWIRPSASAAPAWSAVAVPVGASINDGYLGEWSSGPFSMPSFDTANAAHANGAFKLWTLARDKAGNQSLAVSYDLTINQASDTPSVNLATMDSSHNTAPAAFNNLFSNSPTLTGSVVDDDMVDRTSIRISINGGAYAAVSGQPASNNTTVAFSHSFSALSGVQYFNIQASDLLASKAGDPVETLTFGPVYFFVDDQVPGFSNPLPATSASFARTSFSLGADLTDNLDIASVSLSQKKNSGAQAAVVHGLNLSGASDSNVNLLLSNFPRDPANTAVIEASPSGIYEFTITVVDRAGRQSVLSRTVTYDTTPPVLEMAAIGPIVAANQVNGVISFTASASDANGLSEVRYWVLPAANPAPAWADAGHTTLSSAPYLASLDTTTLTDGQNYTLWVKTQDKAGNESTINQTLAVNQASDDPAISISNLNALIATAGAVNSTTNLLESNPKIQGVITDDDMLNASTIEIRLDANDDGDFTDPDDINWVAVSNAGANGKSVSFEQSLSSTPQDVMKFYLRASDLAANKAGKPAVSKTIGPVYFAIDKFAPALAVTQSSGSLQRVNFTLSGTASDANGLTGNVVTIKDAADALVANPALAAGAWSTSVNVAALSEGLKEWTVTATDLFGKSTTLPFSFTVDKTAPLTAVTTPAAASWVSGATLTALGTASDANGVALVEYSINSTNGVDGTWAAASNTSNWSVILNLATLGEGNKNLWIRASDVAGNTSTALQRSFGVDQTAPASSIAAVDSGASTIFASSSAASASASAKLLFTLSGTATDSNSVSSVVVKQNTVNQTVTYSPPGTSLAWSVASLPNGGLVDGTFNYEIIITDAAGNVTNYTRQVRIDLNAPTVSITDPASNGAVLVGSAYSLTGTADDGAGSGVSLIEVSTDGGSIWTSATGTSNWNKLLNLNTLGEGARSVRVRATDAAGNVSGASIRTYYIDQVAPTINITAPTNTVNNATFTLAGTAFDTNLTAVDVRINGGAWSAATGTSTWTRSITMASLSLGLNTIEARATDIASRTTSASVTVYKDQEAPTFAFNNAGSDGLTVLQDSSPKLVGTVNDASGSTSLESYLEKWNYSNSTWNMVQTWTTVGSPAGATVYSWTKDLVPAPISNIEGRYRITLRASDVAGPVANSSTGTIGQLGESVIFRIDRSNPALALSAPNVGSYQRLDFSVTGTSSDLNTVTGVKIKLNSSDFSSGTIDASSGDNFATWSASVATAALTAGTHTIYIQSSDGSGRTTVLTRDFTFDNTRPGIVVIDPLSGTAVNGAIKVKGTSSDTNAVTSVQMRLGKDLTWNTLAGVYNWEYSFTNIDSYANITYADETSPSSGIWRLFLDIRATDTAGNVKYFGDNNNDGDIIDGGDTPYYIDLDPSQDLPQLTIYQPLNNQTVGGATRVYGIATDDDAVFRVEMRIDLNNDGLYNSTADYWNYSGTGTPTLTPDGDTNDVFENEATWHVISGTNNWFNVINQFGEYNSTTPGQTRTIKVQVRAVDTKNGSTAGVNGNPSEITITFDNTIPIIENVKIDLDAIDNNGNETNYSTGLRVAGTFYIVADVKDESGITEIVRLEEGPLTGFDRIDDDGAITTNLGFSSGYYRYRVRIPINSKTIGSGVFDQTSGTYSISLKATDNSNPNPFVTYNYITVQVDNYHPTGAYTNVQDVLGTNYKVQGSATDVGAGSGVVQGIDRVVTWFEKSGSVYNLLADESSVNLAANSTVLNVKDMSAGGTLQNINYPNNTWRINIDRLTEVGVSDAGPNGDVDGYLESLTQSGNTFEWWAEVNTQNLPDGPLTLNYLIFDKAGNATRYTQSLFVKNNAPIITGVTLGTDLNADGDTLDAGETSLIAAINYSASGYTVRNDRLSFNIASTGGNGTKYYSVKYPNAAGAEIIVPVTAGSFTTGRLYRIAVPGTTTFTSVGAANNNVDTIFVATGAGTGTGVAYQLSSAGSIVATAMVTGQYYYIATVGSTTFTNFGASSNTSGTLFTANATGTGTGTVIRINSLPSASSGTVLLTNFSAPASIPDGGINSTAFYIRVYDSTPGTTPGIDSLQSSLTINLTADNVDNTTPTLSIAPFGQTWSGGNSNASKSLLGVSAYNNNIKMSGSNRLGHVEYAADSLYNGTDADISGEVIMKGRVWDDQRIQKITAQIAGFDPDGGGAAIAGSEFDLYTFIGGALTGTGWTMALDGDSAAEGSNGFLTQSNGNVLNWNFTWNTALISNGASANLVVNIKVYDFGSNTATTTETVDVVPYITGIVRTSLNTNRTKYGAYPLSRSETGVVVSGYNLLSSSIQSANNWIRVYNTSGVTWDNGAGDANGSFTNAQITGASTARTGLTLALPATLKTGYLRFNVNSVTDGNRVNNNTLSYNKEDDGSGLGSTLWSDDRYLWLWTVDQGFNTSDGAEYPSMSMLANGTLYGSWITYASSQLWLGTTGAGPTLQWGIFDPPEYSDLAIDTSEGGTLKYSIAFAANHFGGSGWGTSPIAPNSGGFVGVRTPNSPNIANGYANALAYPIESLNVDQQLWQFQRPKTVRYNVGTDAQDIIHTAYYDVKSKSLKYSMMNDDAEAMLKGYLVIDGGTDANDTDVGTVLSAIAVRGSQLTATVAGWIANGAIGVGDMIALRNGTLVSYKVLTAWNSGTGLMTWTGNVATSYTSVQIITNGSGSLGVVSTGLASSTSTGSYLAIDVDENGLPVIAYYDTPSQTLRLAVANKSNPIAAADWTRQSVFDAGDSLKQFSGQYVTIKFDQNGGLHLACFRSSTGDFVYLFAPDADSGNPYTFDAAVAVDTAGSVGAWADISLQGLVPHLSYLNSTMIGTSDGIKYASWKLVTANPQTSSNTTSVTASSLVGTTAVAANQVVVFSDGQTRSISSFNSGSGTINWVSALGSSPTGTFKVVDPSVWDNQIAPASGSYAVTDQRTSIETRRSTGTAWTATWGDIAIGYRSGRFELMYLQSEP